MMNLSKTHWNQIRRASLWITAVFFALFGVWTVSQWWMLLGADASWRALLVPTIATIGAISLSRRSVEAARRQPVPVRLVSKR